MAPRPSGPHLAQRLRTLALTQPPASALFYAYQYRAYFPPTELEHDSVHVLALVQLASGNTYPALDLVREFADADADPSHDIPDYENGIPARRPGCYGCAVIVAKCCAKLGRYTEGEAVLDRAIRRSVPLTLPSHNTIETAATASLLAAQLSHKSKASTPGTPIEYYTRALTDDPWLWEAFTGLCDIGAAPPADAVFTDPPSMMRTSSSQRASRQPTLSPGPMPRSSASEVPNFLSRRQLSPIMGAPASASLFTPDAGAGAVPSRVHMMGSMAGWDSPGSAMGDTTFSAMGEPTNGRARMPTLIQQFIPGLRSTPAMEQGPAKAPPAMKRPRGGHNLKMSDTPVGGMAIESRLNRDLRSMEINGGDKMLDPPVRRSSRLNTGKTTTSRVTTREKRSTRSQSVASSGSGHEANQNQGTLEAQTAAAVDEWLRDIVRRCGRVYRALSLYQCREALAEIDALPRELQASPFVLRLMAKSFYFMSEYKKGARVFQRLLELEPYTLAQMDMYSTLLWHMNDATALSDLSQRLMSVDRESAEAWIASGNTLSVLKQHEEAARLFRRATQVDPGRATAWTLCGHEAWMTEETDRAIAFYRTAIRTDAREQAAWYGLGHVYFRQGKWRHAEHHFRRASEINPSSAPLLCALGEALERGGDLVGALAEFDRAVALEHDVDRLVTRYKRARVLIALGRVQEGITELEPVARSATDEPDVHLLLGKCYLKMRRNADAVVAFTTAREMDPKLEGAVRSVLRGGGVEEQ
ncbi:TPR-like protein [Cutaneotrichosporon oleaginosum]|uniref:TPR-like protein n=1 Tax=Cutaneotrichosporon oleaginosum TaxID=879819 RepID=A0A0J0XSF3_9TREE|nr:TPR-like protein [Cutaneotrichosporon oleaginosum]KLT43995.1 TPR-like protein [Cutaneotrichosporon oleaginosum]TXT04058.1 hypothetical protein COLE_07755 [Cutaneotrichosporon oleaginosum]